jgi:membrane fusion protein (multidrug efflux system)
LALPACGKKPDDARNRGMAEVGFRVMRETAVPIVTQLPGRVNALRNAEVRPQISGVIQKRLFSEGALVRQGQPLYQIDPSL